MSGPGTQKSDQYLLNANENNLFQFKSNNKHPNGLYIKPFSRLLSCLCKTKL